MIYNTHMTQFKDLEQYLQDEEAARQMVEEERARKLLEARDGHIPALRKAYAVFGDFYVTILKPRGYRIFPRKKEGLTPNELRNLNDRTVLYAYAANVVSPRSEQPYPSDWDPMAIWLNPVIGELDYHVWHPNVALHFATTITPKPRSRGEGTDLSVEVRAWGRVEVDANALAEQGMTLSYQDAGWNSYATFVTLHPKDDRLEQQVEAGLRLVTPNVIHHKEAFRG